jgi:PelA/Pel-15E family pectate lyase
MRSVFALLFCTGSIAAWCPSIVLASEADAPARWGANHLKHAADWYASAEAQRLAGTLLLYQSPHGAWPKNTDLFKTASAKELAAIHAGPDTNTIDNHATTRPMRFLALVNQAAPNETYQEAFLRGLDYLLAAQLPSGGWPQFFPLRPTGYYSHVTYNDDAMINVLVLLQEVAGGGTPYDFVDAARRTLAANAITRGIDCILKTQIRQGGQLTGWCAQHDRTTLQPVWARSFEPPSLSGSETVGIVRFLMSLDPPTPAVIAAVEGAVTWLRRVALAGVRIEAVPGTGGKSDRRLVNDPNAPLLWARFYELGTNRPLYVDRDSVFQYDFAKIGYERRSNYDYHGTWPALLLERDYPRWRARIGAATASE